MKTNRKTKRLTALGTGECKEPALESTSGIIGIIGIIYIIMKSMRDSMQAALIAKAFRADSKPLFCKDAKNYLFLYCRN